MLPLFLKEGADGFLHSRARLLAGG